VNVPLHDVVHVGGVKKPQLPIDTSSPGGGTRLSIVIVGRRVMVVVVVVVAETGSGPDGALLLQADARRRAPGHDAARQNRRVASLLNTRIVHAYPFESGTGNCRAYRIKHTGWKVSASGPWPASISGRLIADSSLPGVQLLAGHSESLPGICSPEA
jgi:hypothetical protein